MEERLKTFRKYLRFSQSRMGEALGTTQQTYANYESGRSKPPHEVMRKLSDMGLDTQWLLYGNGSMLNTNTQLSERQIKVTEDAHCRAEHIDLKMKDYIELREELAGWKREAVVYKEVNEKILDRLEHALLMIEKGGRS